MAQLSETENAVDIASVIRLVHSWHGRVQPPFNGVPLLGGHLVVTTRVTRCTVSTFAQALKSNSKRNILLDVINMLLHDTTSQACHLVTFTGNDKQVMNYPKALVTQ